jgi:hypothetical protein
MTLGIGLVYAVGLLTIAAAAGDWGWFMRNRHQRKLERALGNRGARAFLVAWGLALVGMATWALLGRP